MQRVLRPNRIIASLLLFTALTTAFGEKAFAGAGLLAQAQTPAQNVVSGRSFTVEIGIVVIMFGGALFAVCRSSNRT